MWVIPLGAFLFSTPLFASWNEIWQEGWTKASQFKVAAYSEFTPAFQAGVREYELFLDTPAVLKESYPIREFYDSQDPSSFKVSLYDEKRFIQPAMKIIANRWLKDLQKLIKGEAPGSSVLKGIPEAVVYENPFWPTDIPKYANHPIVSFTPLVLSRTHEDLGHYHPWTLYGSSPLDWEEIFWRHTLPHNSVSWFCKVLNSVFDISSDNCDLKTLGFRILTDHADWIPQALQPLILKEPLDSQTATSIRYLVTFKPYGGTQGWPETLRKAYQKGTFVPLPHPATLLFSRSSLFEKMAPQSTDQESRQLPLAIEMSQISNAVSEIGNTGVKILDVSTKRNRFSRRALSENSPIQSRVVLPVRSENNPFAVIFEPIPHVMGLYGKPIARNVQMWGMGGTLAGRWILDGSRSDLEKIRKARELILKEASHTMPSTIFYRNYQLPMQINDWSVIWHRPLVAWIKPGQSEVMVDPSEPGVFRFLFGNRSLLLRARIVDRGQDLLLSQMSDADTALNFLKIREFYSYNSSKPVSQIVANALLNPVPPDETFDKWKQKLPPPLRASVTQMVEPKNDLIVPVTFDQTINSKSSHSEFEYSYWKKLVQLTEGVLDNSEKIYSEKNSADCSAIDSDPDGTDPHCHQNRLREVAQFLRRYYQKLGLSVYTHTFEWKPEIPIPWWQGANEAQENLIAVIPGENREEAIIMADHYDTAYAGDNYEGQDFIKDGCDLNAPVNKDLKGHRHAAKGADDNYSGTVSLMEAARILKTHKLKRDVWLVHITGEEFPADSLGTRAFVQALIENKQLTDRKNPKIVGVYQLDMVGHHTDRDHNAKARAIFQISPGRGTRSVRLAEIAQRVAYTWNHLLDSEQWNTVYNRKQYWSRFKVPINLSPSNYPLPKLGKFIPFRSEIRPSWHPRSSLYNTDAQIYSDSGFPVVLFMENYDIERCGYHDTLDNLENIDLDYARGLAAITIETVAKAASQ